jgi:hypothetical protein
MKGRNLIGFNFGNRRYKWQDDKEWSGDPVYLHCVWHHVRLIPKKGEPDTYWCPRCGNTERPYLQKEVATEEDFEPTASPQSKTRIISPKRKKKYFDDSGNEITDPDLISLVQRGMHVIKYHEEKIEGDPKKPKGHIVRRK